MAVKAGGADTPEAETLIAAGPRSRRQTARTDRWDAAKERTFIAELAQSANVRMSLRAVGMSAASLYYRRRTRPAFRMAWDEALNEGYALLEAQLLNEALNGAAHTVVRSGESATEYRPASDSVRINLLNQHAKRVAEFRASGVAKANEAAHYRALIEKRLDRLAAWLDAQEAGDMRERA